jgi:hypothetical protein
MAETLPTWRGSTLIAEQKGSPQFKFGKTVTCRRVFRGRPLAIWAARAYKGDSASVPNLGGGTIPMTVVGCDPGMDPSEVGLATMTIDYEGAPEDINLPPTEVSIEHAQQELAVEKHPTWKAKFETTDPAFEGGKPLGPQRLAALNKAIKNGLDLQQIQDDPELRMLVNSSSAGYDADVYNVLKLRMQGIHTYAIFPTTVQVVTYHLTEPVRKKGGYLEDPQTYGVTLSTEEQTLYYLRLGDKTEWTGTYFRWTKSWMGAPNWDGTLYPT